MHDETMPRLTENVSTPDRVIRFALGIAMLWLGLSGIFPETLSGALRIASILPFVTAALGWCPVYELFGALRGLMAERRAGRRIRQEPIRPATDADLAPTGRAS